MTVDARKNCIISQAAPVGGVAGQDNLDRGRLRLRLC